MKKLLTWLVLALATAAHAAAFALGTPPLQELKPVQPQPQAAHLAAELLTRYHYKALPLDDAMSEKIFDQYLKALDPEKVFFVQADIDRMSDARTVLDDAILKEDLTVPFAMFNLYTNRMAERFAQARALLHQTFDFQRQESYQFSRENAPWAKSDEEMHDLWRKRVKNDWLRLKLAGKDDKGIVETLDKRYGNALKRIGKVTGKDAFQAFMNAYTTAIEPHTNYLGPRAAEDFGTAMKLSLVGIGARLEDKDDYCTIRELLAGGPAILSGELKIGDRILGVAQGRNGSMIDIQGWRLDDAVAIIRGAADSVVVLDVLPADAGPDGKHRLISLVRKKITLEDQAARKSILSVKDGEAVRRVGVISLPSFYEDFEARQKRDPAFRSAARDVARLLGELKKEKVDGVLIDLRNNGGGSLDEAVELTGLFIGNGPVVQQRDARGNLAALDSSARRGIVWDGPLGVLIDRASASASEIFAAAIQDYGRGVVIGAPSFGKGTVQTMISLDQVAKSGKRDFGELKMTIAQFFRVNGGTTQLRGVEPDIRFPAVSDADTFGESAFGNALPWVQVKAAAYLPAGDLKYLLPALRDRHQARVDKDIDYQNLKADIAQFKLLRRKNMVSLNETERRKERDALEARLATRQARRDAVRTVVKEGAGGEAPSADANAIRDDGLQADERTLASELAAEKAGKNARDALLDEAAHILSDQVELMKASARFVARLKEPSPNAAEENHTAEAIRSGIW